MSNVTSIANKMNDARRWTLKQMLEDALIEADNQNKDIKKAIILYWNGDDNTVEVGFAQCGMTTMESLLLCELAKDRIKAEIYDYGD